MFSNSTKFDIKIPNSIDKVKSRKVSLPFQKKDKSEEKIVIIFDYLHRSDSKLGKLCSGVTKDFMKMIDSRTKRRTGKSIFDYSVCTINYSHFVEDKTVEDGKEDEDSTGGIEKVIDSLNTKRLLEFLKVIKPTRVICIGQKSFNVMRKYYVKDYVQQISYTSLLGIPKLAKFDDLEFSLIPMLNINMLCSYTTSRETYLIGYFSRCWDNVVLGKVRYKANISHKNLKCIKINTLEKFDKMLAILKKKSCVAIDTESSSLNRVANTMLTIQFAYSADKAFFLPYKHYDTPFTSKDLEYIKNKLAEYFLESANKLHIYCNANFDIPLIRKELEIPFYPTEIWDVQAGEYALDENMVELATATGNGYYNLGNLAIQYGFDGYHRGKFGKEDRVGISKVTLDTPGLVEYACYDVSLLIAIREQQLLRAAEEKHAKYENVVKNLIGNTIHTFSTMNVNGILIDQPYLWGLSSSNSPINQEVLKMEDALLSSEEIRKAEKLIGKDSNIPTSTLFGDVIKRTTFSLRKKLHLRTLFFKVLKLEPINVGADGPSLDKEFQEEYRDNPLVSAYTNLNKAKKIRDAFVKSLIKIVSKNEDAKLTGRIRSSYKYLMVVTGRTSSTDPNLQQIPAHGKLAGYIKRAFVASPGTIFIKVDYSAHEVRGLALVGNDKVLAGAFQRGLDLYDEYLKNPTPYALKKHAEEGDIHIINACFFFGLKPHEVTKLIRQSVKAVVFGLIYGRSAPSIAAALGRPLEEVEDVMKKFFARFRDGAKWLKGTVEFARKNAFVEAPTGLRRHLWPYLLPQTNETKRDYESLAAACDRRANNCIVGSSLITTNYGLVPISALVGKEFSVQTVSGKYVPAGICIPKGKKNVMNVSTKSGFSITGTPDHEVLVLRDKAVLKWVAIQDLRIGDYMCAKKSYESTNGVPLEPTATFKKKKLTPELALCLGYMWAEGSQGSYSRTERYTFSNGDEFVLNDFASNWEKVSTVKFKNFGDNSNGTTILVANSTKLHKDMQFIGAVMEKQNVRYTPDVILAANKECVAAYLQGLFEGDGYVATKHVGIELSSLQLLRETKLLLTQFGIASEIYKRREAGPSKIRGIDCNVNESWCLNIVGSNVDLFREHIGFRSERKQERLVEISEGKRRFESRSNAIPGLSSLIDEAKSKLSKFSSSYKGKRINLGGAKPDTAKLNTPEFVESIEHILGSKKARRVERLRRFNLRFDPIVDIHDSGEQEVFDICVPEKEHFVANGLVIHNSPIQGMGSGIGYSAARFLENWTFSRFKKWSLKHKKLPIRNQNMVHDSMEHEVEYSHIGYALEMIQHSLTKGVQSYCIDKFGMKFPVDLSIEMDIGGALDNVEKWDGSIQSLYNLLKSTLEFQRDEMKYDVDVEKVLTKVFTGYLPQFLVDQAYAGYFEQAELYGLKVDKKLAAKNRAELKRQYDEMEAAKKAKAEAEAKAKAATAKS